MEILSRVVEGLEVRYNVSLSPDEVEAATVIRLQEVAKGLKIDGFRPGKAPIEVVQRRYGEAARSETVEKLVSATAKDILKNDNVSQYVGLRFDIVKNDSAGVEFTLQFETVPTVELADFSTLEIKRYKAEITDVDVDDMLSGYTKLCKKWVEEPEDVAVDMGHKTLVELYMKPQPVPQSKKQKQQPQMASETQDINIVIGSSYVLEELWKPLLGTKVSDIREFPITYPRNINDRSLAGKTFDCSAKVKKIFRQTDHDIDDEFAIALGHDNLAAARDWARSEVTDIYTTMSRDVAKVRLLEIISKMYDFPVPSSLFQVEYPRVVEQITMEANKLKKKMTPLIEKECRKIAEDRIRLGLVVSKVAGANGITVSNTEISNSIRSLIEQYPQLEKRLLNLYANDQTALNVLIGSIAEDKVVNFLLSKINVVEESCSVKELIAMDEEEFDFFRDDTSENSENDDPPEVEALNTPESAGVDSGEESPETKPGGEAADA
ncbi:MAG: trigger factor [Holosporaceae bacterium]|jgi:trigger factor|nr:trigger factor [Holosporaceae bacterium]